MSGEEDKIYADAKQPATLIDGDMPIDCPTLGDAVVATGQSARAAKERRNDQGQGSGLHRFRD
jgi:hypothetical protein